MSHVRLCGETSQKLSFRHSHFGGWIFAGIAVGFYCLVHFFGDDAGWFGILMRGLFLFFCGFLCVLGLAGAFWRWG